MTPESERSGSGRAIGIGGAALTIAVIAVIAVVLLNRPADQAADGSAEPTVGSSPFASPSAPASPIETASPSVEPTSSATIQPASEWQEAAAFGAAGTLERAESVTWSADGLIAVGTYYGVEEMPHSGPVPQEGRVWHSADGRSWDDVTPLGMFDDAGLRHVFVTADGSLIAIGLVAEASENATPTAWESADGRDWRPTSLGLPGYWRIDRLVSGAKGYLALISVGPDIYTTGDRGLWLSADGRTWELVRAGAPETAEHFLDIGAGDDGFAVTGSRGEAFAPFAMASSDGRTWIEATVPPQRPRADRGPRW